MLTPEDGGCWRRMASAVVFPSKHAIGLNRGQMEYLLHIGVDYGET